jgi:hypothetical protein
MESLETVKYSRQRMNMILKARILTGPSMLAKAGHGHDLHIQRNFPGINPACPDQKRLCPMVGQRRGG